MADVNANVSEPNANTPSAEPKVEPSVEPKKEEPVVDSKAEPKQKEPSVQELMVELARMKRAVDKASSEAAEYKKKYNSTLSEKEIADQAKADEEAKRKDEFESMKRRLQISDYSKQYISIGYSQDDAEKIATAQADGDTDAVFRLQREFQTQHDKALTEQVSKSFYEHPERVNAGVEANKDKDPFLEGFNHG